MQEREQHKINQEHKPDVKWEQKPIGGVFVWTSCREQPNKRLYHHHHHHSQYDCESEQAGLEIWEIVQNIGENNWDPPSSLKKKQTPPLAGTGFDIREK